MKRDLVIHPLSAEELEVFTNHPTHLLALVAPSGFGRGTIAQNVLETILSVETKQFNTNQFIRKLGSPDKSIGIEAVRELQTFLQLKTVGIREFRRGVIIEYAENLTIEAQNALLKILEEPPADTIIILTINGLKSLASTIYSRAQVLILRNPTKSQLEKFYVSRGLDPKSFEQAYYLCGALPGLLHAVIEKDSEHPLVVAINEVKKILLYKKYERLQLINGFSKDKIRLAEILTALRRISISSIESSSVIKDDRKIKLWLKVLRHTLEAERALELNANAKLLMTNLLLSI